MKILFTTEYFIRSNGVSNVVYNLAKVFSKKHDVFIAAYSNKISREWRGESFNIMELGHSHKKFKALWNLKKIIEEIDPDVIHTHTCLGLAPKLAGYRYVSTYHGWGIVDELLYGGSSPFIRLFWSFPMILFTLSGAEVITTVSKFISKKISKFGFKSVVIPNGIPSEIISRKPKEFSGQYRFLFVGSISRRKGAHLLPKIMEIINSRVNAKLDVVGRPLDKDIVVMLRKSKYIRYYGEVKDVFEFYRNADFFLFPSLHESFGITILEAFANGLPVITWNRLPFVEIVNNRNGFLFNSLDDFKSDRFYYFLNSNYSKLSRAAINTAKHYTWDKISRKYLKIYKKVW